MNDKEIRKLKNEELGILNFFDKFCERNGLRYYLIGGTLLGAIRHDGFIPWDDDIDIAMPREDYELFLKKFPKNEKKFTLDAYNTNKNYWLPFAKVRINGTAYIESDQKGYDGHTGIWLDVFPLDYGSKFKWFDKIRFFITKKTRFVITRKMGLSSKPKSMLGGVISKIMSMLPKKLLLAILDLVMKCGSSKSGFYVNLGSQYGYKKQRHQKEWYSDPQKHLFEGQKYNVPKRAERVLRSIYGANYMELPPKDKRVTHNPIYVRFSDGEIVDLRKNDKN